ncbi:unnamed protein product, partial [marine sediment metagenome]
GVRDMSPRLRNVLISGCVVTGNVGGIRFDNVSDSCIADCYVHNNSWTSIYVILSPDNVTIENCTVADNGAFGHPGSVHVSGSNVSITGCRIYDNWNEGIWLYLVNHADISYNTIYGNTAEGITVHGGSGPVSDVVIHDNDMKDRIYFADCIDAVTVEYNNASGVFARRSSGNRICENNFIGSGVRLDDSPHNIISGNIIADSSEEGVCLVSSPYTTVS